MDGLSNGIYAGSLRSTESHLVSADIDGNVSLAAGHIFFVKNGGLQAQPFDPELLKLASDPTVIT
jgi:hypothetical protein